jgi:2-oxoisovalerate dehydrogenase E1 component beta subunit
MSKMNMIQAIRSALEVMLERDPSVCVFGEDVGYFGGVFRATQGLQQRFGPQRVFDTPLAEGGIIGVAIGMGLNGLRPVPEIQFSDYIFPAFDQITNELAKLRYRSGGEWTAPLTIRAPSGGGIRGGLFHSQSPEAYFTHTPGLRVVIPSNPRDAKGLLVSSIECDDPVIFFEPKRLYRGPFHGNPEQVPPWRDQPEAEVPDGHFTTPLGQAALVRAGDEVTVVSWGTMVHVAASAIEEAELDAELIDLRTLVPLDLPAIVASVEKTGRCIVVHEAPRTCGFGAEIAALVQQHCFWSLEAPVARVTGWDTPLPHAQEMQYMPSRDRIVRAMQTALAA